MGRTFAGFQQLEDHYGALGFTVLSKFERAQWPAKVFHQKNSTNEISFTFKKGGRHGYPGHNGYWLKAVSLEDSTGGETVVILKSKERVVPP